MFRAVTKLTLVQHVARHAQRNIGVTAAMAQAASKQSGPSGVTDPIQKLFLDKIREYKSKSAGGKLVDATPDVEARLQDSLDKVDRMFNAKGQDMTKFPAFTFTDPKLEAVGLGETRDLEVEEVEEAEVEEEEDNKPYFVK